MVKPHVSRGASGGTRITDLVCWFLVLLMASYLTQVASQLGFHVTPLDLNVTGRVIGPSPILSTYQNTHNGAVAQDFNISEPNWPIVNKAKSASFGPSIKEMMAKWEPRTRANRNKVVEEEDLAFFVHFPEETEENAVAKKDEKQD